jgi:hypothetical protein
MERVPDLKRSSIDMRNSGARKAPVDKTENNAAGGSLK